MRFRTAIISASTLLNVLLVAMTILVWLRNPQSRYPLLSQRIFVGRPNDVVINFTPLRGELQSFVRQKTGRVGIYFEYLPSGVSIGVNEKDEFVPASLLKVPLVMGVYRMIELGILRPDTPLTVRPEDVDDDWGTLWRRGAGAEVTVGEAIRHALEESDNTAVSLLNAVTAEDVILDVFNGLDIPFSSLEENIPAVSPKNYSSILRCLYLSCYVAYEHSQEILQYLTQSVYRDGLPAGVPPDVPVAHKIGSFQFPLDLKGVRSDCGVVYVPRRPYLLCVFAELGPHIDRDERQAELVIADVSRIVYRFIAGIR